MDEEMRETDLWELHLLRMEDSFTKKSYESILSWKIYILQEALAKEKSQNTMGVYNPPQKDKQKLQYNNKKQECKTYLHWLNQLGTTLVEMRQYDQLMEFFSTSALVISWISSHGMW